MKTEGDQQPMFTGTSTECPKKVSPQEKIPFLCLPVISPGPLSSPLFISLSVTHLTIRTHRECFQGLPVPIHPCVSDPREAPREGTLVKKERERKNKISRTLYFRICMYVPRKSESTVLMYCQILSRVSEESNGSFVFPLLPTDNKI